MTNSSGNLKLGICYEISKHDEIYMTQSQECKPNHLADINGKVCLGKSIFWSAIKDLDSSHPHFNWHDTNKLGALFSIVLTCIIKNNAYL